MPMGQVLNAITNPKSVRIRWFQPHDMELCPLEPQLIVTEAVPAGLFGNLWAGL